MEKNLYEKDYYLWLEKTISLLEKLDKRKYSAEKSEKTAFAVKLWK